MQFYLGFLKGLCHKDSAVLGQFRAEVISYRDMKQTSNNTHHGALTIGNNCFGDFAGIALKLENVGSMFSRIHVHLCHPSQEAT